MMIALLLLLQFAPTAHAQRTFEDSTGFYLIRFDYDTGWALTPSTYPPGQPHYTSLITVLQVIDGETGAIGEPFWGVYTEGGCFEDNPETLVQWAKKLLAERATRDE